MLGVKSFDPCREFGCFQSLFFIVVDHCGPFTLAVVKSQVVLRSPFVERFHCIAFFIIIFDYFVFNYIKQKMKCWQGKRSYNYKIKLIMTSMGKQKS